MKLPGSSRRNTCVVTGAAGFIGSHLCERLCADGWLVVGVDRRSPMSLGSLQTQPRFSFVNDDFVGPEATAALRHAGAVFHLAARTGARGADEVAYVSDNVARTAELLRACRVAGVRRLIYASSSSVYGAVGAGPQREDSALVPANPYGRSKLKAEQLCWASDLCTIVLRFFTVYGPRQRPDMAFATFIRAALTGIAAPLYGLGRGVRDFTYVQDAVDGCVLAARLGRGNHAYNISGGRSVRVSEAIPIIEEVLGAKVPLTASEAAVPEAKQTAADLSLSSMHLAYSPRVALSEGLRAQIAASR